jgi:hypothetical protein
MALEFGVEVTAAEDVQQAFIGMARDADKSAGELAELFHCGGALALGGSQLHTGDEAAQVLVALTGFRQKGIRQAVRASDFRTDVGADAGFFRSHVKARRAIDPVAVEQRHGRHAQRRASADKFFRHGSAFKKAETATGVEFNVHNGL